jgi:hypothetical protein
MTIFTEGSGYVGGYLVTNSWGRPLEFRLSTAVQPNKIQQILYADTLTEYLCADLIGKTLIDKTATPVQLLFVDTLLALPLRSRLEVPVLAVLPKDSPEHAQVSETEHRRLHHRSFAGPLIREAKHDADGSAIQDLLDRIDAGLDVSEPFLRIREAMGEARKMGVSRGTTQAA